MIHLGDITKISGRDAPTVNVIIGGSPCQDLSVAGKRAGLEGERSGLFMEQIRIIKEMRAKDAESGRTGADIRPRFMVWENVPGAFSVNGGRDFAAVLEETIRVVDEEAPDILLPPKGWTNSGCYMGDGWSVAWRVLDAQFWGVPQRRRRIALVADFGGECATEVLFERESMSGHFKPSETARKGTAGNAADSTGTAVWVRCLNPEFPQSARVYDADGVRHSLNANSGGGQSRDSVLCLQGNGIGRSDNAGCAGRGWSEDVCYTVNTVDRPAVVFPINTMVASIDSPESRTAFGIGEDGDPQFTISRGHEHAVCYGICSDKSNAMLSDNPHSGVYEADTSRTLDNNCGNPACNQGGIAVCYPETSRSLCARSDSSPCIDRGQEFVAYEAPISFQERAGCNGVGKGILCQHDKTATLSTLRNQAVCFVKTTKPHSAEEATTITESDISPALTTFDTGESRASTYVCFESHDQDVRYRPLGDVSETVSAKYGTGGGNQPIVISCWNGQSDIASHITGETASTLTAHLGKEAADLACAVDIRNGTENPDINGTLQAKENGGTSLNLNNVVRQRYIVRRLTPLECERLQGFPDGWTDIGDWIDSKGKKRKMSDSARYKALGNSIAIPPWLWVLSRLNEYCDEKTMASLFDGIGGFPLIWEFLNGTGSAVWASEIEEFPIAVTKFRFPGGESGA